jgi:hypothetical protein
MFGLAAIICFAISGTLFSMTIYALFFDEGQSNNYFLIFVLMPFVLILTGVGGAFYKAARRKICPQCADKVPYKTLQCKHCGHQFPEQKSGGPFQPFYD